MISIVIPVYNGSNYIDQCVKSILCQTSNDYEVIFVDDGSYDDSYDKLLHYQKESNNFYVYKKLNGGVSSARNYGISRTNGDIITFLDIDDWINPDYISFIIDHIDENDIIMFDSIIINHKKKGINKLFEYNIHSFIENEKERLYCQCISYRFGKHFKPRYHGCGAICGKAYKKVIIDKLRFNEGQRMSEDSVFNIEAIYNANSIIYYSKPLYNVRKDNYSASRSYDPDYLKTMSMVNNSFRNCINRLKIKSDMINDALEYRLQSDIEKTIVNIFANGMNNRKNKYYSNIIESDIVNESINNIHIRHLGVFKYTVLLLLRNKIFTPITIYYTIKKYIKKIIL